MSPFKRQEAKEWLRGIYVPRTVLNEEPHGIVKAILNDCEVVQVAMSCSHVLHTSTPLSAALLLNCLASQSPEKTMPRAGNALEFEEIEIGMRVRPVGDVHALRALCERVPEGATNCVSWNDDMATIAGDNFIVVAKRGRYQVRSFRE